MQTTRWPSNNSPTDWTATLPTLGQWTHSSQKAHHLLFFSFFSQTSSYLAYVPGVSGRRRRHGGERGKERQKEADRNVMLSAADVIRGVAGKNRWSCVAWLGRFAGHAGHCRCNGSRPGPVSRRPILGFPTRFLSFASPVEIARRRLAAVVSAELGEDPPCIVNCHSKLSKSRIGGSALL